MRRNCDKSALLCTGQQLLCHFSLLPVLKVRVVARDFADRNDFDEITGHHACLHVTDSSVSESVHSTGSDAEFVANGCENPPANISVFQWRAHA
jgi:hypothetical protein